MLCKYYGTINKTNLKNIGVKVMIRFNNANFKAKRSGCKQKINRVEVVEHGTAVYFWCSHITNFVVYGGSKKGTYEKLNDLLMHICFEENNEYINISDFIVKR